MIQEVLHKTLKKHISGRHERPAVNTQNTVPRLEHPVNWGGIPAVVDRPQKKGLSEMLRPRVPD